MPTVWIPSLLQSLTRGASRIQIAGETLGELLDCLERQYPGFKERLLDGEGGLQPEIVAAIDGEIAHLGLREHLRPDSEIQFIPAISGGQVASSVRQNWPSPPRSLRETGCENRASNVPCHFHGHVFIVPAVMKR
ncbi:MAG: MoaD/ThiS family protein [Dehalococcoidia bacterium]